VADIKAALVIVVQSFRVLKKTNIPLGLQSASELYRLSDRNFLAKFNANFCG
jgi:hypothetical protein